MNTIYRLGVGSACLTVAILFSFSNSVAAVPLFNLGEAAAYSALILPNGQMDIKGGAAVNGDVGAARNSHIDLGSGAKVGIRAGTGDVVSGKIYLDPNGATVKLDNQNPNSVVYRNLDQAVADAIAASDAAAMLTPTQSFPNGLSLNGGNFTFNSIGLNNVISLSSLTMAGSAVLTLNGGANDYFVFNITGTLNMSSKSTMQLTGGLLASHILWNFIGAGSDPNIHSGGTAYGTFLAPKRGISVDDSTVVGALISGGQMKIGSKALVVSPVTNL